jgi:hypothetical protein
VAAMPFLVIGALCLCAEAMGRARATKTAMKGET